MLYSKGYYHMKPIPPEIKILYDAALIEKDVAPPAHFHYRKWLRYYLDFCLKYHHKPVNKESLAPFIQKLKANETAEGSDLHSLHYAEKNYQK